MTMDAYEPDDRFGSNETARDAWEEWATDDPDYPRRQLQRERWLNLNGDWRFAYDDEGRVTHPRHIRSWDRTIRVPFAPESSASGIGDRSFHADVWYSRDFELTLDPGRRALLHFGAVDYEAQVWVDDVFVGHHEGGHTSFVFDVSDASNPREVAYFVPEAPPGRSSIQFNDVLVASDGLVYVTDRFTGGLYILERTA